MVCNSMKILPNGVCVIDGDTHISKWVEEHGKLSIAEDYLSPFRKYVPEGGTVIDAGANIGDHAITYSKWVGNEGRVFAFEPNPDAFECLVENVPLNVIPLRYGLGSKRATASICKNENVGASFLHGDSGGIIINTLDSFNFSGVDFIKIDVEGYETQVILGALKTIEESRPAMLVEVNSGALLRAGSSSLQLSSLIGRLGYVMTITDRHLRWSSQQFDIICVPKERS